MIFLFKVWVRKWHKSTHWGLDEYVNKLNNTWQIKEFWGEEEVGGGKNSKPPNWPRKTPKREKKNLLFQLKAGGFCFSSFHLPRFPLYTKVSEWGNCSPQFSVRHSGALRAQRRIPCWNVDSLRPLLLALVFSCGFIEPKSSLLLFRLGLFWTFPSIACCWKLQFLAWDGLPCAAEVVSLVPSPFPVRPLCAASSLCLSPFVLLTRTHFLPPPREQSPPIKQKHKK